MKIIASMSDELPATRGSGAAEKGAKKLGNLGDTEAPEDESSETVALVAALASLRQAVCDSALEEQSVLHLSLREVHALQFLIGSLAASRLTTPGMLASYLHISPASTTKLLNRLEREGYISRGVHPEDRRSINIEVSAQAQAAIERSEVWWSHHSRVAAVNLTVEQRVLVTQFLQELSRSVAGDGRS